MLIGIDPDRNGALVHTDPGNHKVLGISRIPLRTHPVSQKKSPDARKLFDLLMEMRNRGAQYVILEGAIVKPQASSKGQAMMGSIHKIHQLHGTIRACCELVFTHTRIIDAWPSVWKKDLNLSSDKDKSFALALELYPDHHRLFARKKNAGIAEALLMTEWGYRKMNSSSKGVDKRAIGS